MNQVAREAGVSKANVFHHFGSKEDLYLAVVRSVRSALTSEIIAIAQTSGGVEQTLTQVAEAELRHLFEHSDQVRLFMRECLEPRAGRDKSLAGRVFGSTFAELVASLRDAQQQGEIRADVSPSFPIMVLVAACVFFFQNADVLRHLPDTDPSITESETFTRELVRLLLHGLRPAA
jgi:TetR/AcrR family transcriptional regulator